MSLKFYGTIKLPSYKRPLKKDVSVQYTRYNAHFLKNQGKQVFPPLKVKFNIKPFALWAICGFFMFYQLLLQSSPSVMIEPLSHDLHTTPLGISLLSSAFFYTYVTLQIPAGILVDRGNIRYIYTFGMCGLALSCLCFSFAENLTTSIFIRICMGVFAAPGLVGAFYLIDQWFFKRYFSFLVGMTEMCTVLGTAIGQAVLAQGVIHLGWRPTFLIYSAIGFIAAILGLCFLRERKPKVKIDVLASIKRVFVKRTTYYQVASDSLIAKGSFKENLKILMNIPDLWIASLISGLAFAILSAFAGFWCIPFLESNAHLSLGQAAVASASIFFGAAICTPFMGVITDKCKHHIISLMTWSFIIVTILLLVLILIPTPPLSIIYILLISIGMLSSVYVIPFALAKKMAPPGVGATAMGIVNVLSILIGAPILQPVIAVIIHAAQSAGISDHHSFVLGLSLFPALTLIAAYLSLLLKKR